MPSRSISAFIALCAALFFAFVAHAQVPSPTPTMTAPSAQAWAVMDLDSGSVLFSHNPDLRLYPASTTKAMTALVGIENAALDSQIRASKKAAQTGESSIYLLEGEKHPLSDYLKAALIRSANDACVAIAEGVSGSEEAFVAKMNAKAKELGANNTNFVNPHGLHDENHYTTARDLALIGRAAASNPTLSRIAAMPSATIGGNWKLGANRVIRNRNRLMLRWPMCDGFKTGYTRQAGHCLIATATRTDPATGKQWRLLSVVLKSASGRSGEDSKWLLEQAFGKFAPRAVATAGQTLWSGPVKGGAAPLEAQTPRGLTIPLRVGEGEITHHEQIVDELKAPIKAGQVVGEVKFALAGQDVATMPLVASADVPKTMLARAVPVVGERVPLLSTPAKIGFWGGFALVFALAILAFKRRKRKRPKMTPARISRTQPRRDLKDTAKGR